MYAAVVDTSQSKSRSWSTGVYATVGLYLVLGALLLIGGSGVAAAGTPSPAENSTAEQDGVAIVSHVDTVRVSSLDESVNFTAASRVGSNDSVAYLPNSKQVVQTPHPAISNETVSIVVEADLSNAVDTPAALEDTTTTVTVDGGTVAQTNIDPAQQSVSFEITNLSASGASLSEFSLSGTASDSSAVRITTTYLLASSAPSSYTATQAESSTGATGQATPNDNAASASSSNQQTDTRLKNVTAVTNVLNSSDETQQLNFTLSQTATDGRPANTLAVEFDSNASDFNGASVGNLSAVAPTIANTKELTARINNTATNSESSRIVVEFQGPDENETRGLGSVFEAGEPITLELAGLDFSAESKAPDRDVRLAVGNTSQTEVDSALGEDIYDIKAALFIVGITRAPDRVTEGDSVPIKCEVTNRGTIRAQQTIRFEVGGEQRASRALTVGSSETVSDNFTYETTRDDVPRRSVSVRTEDDTATASVTVQFDADPATNISVKTQPLATQTAGANLTGPLAIEVTDANGVPAPGVPVNITVTGGDATTSLNGTTRVKTNASGVAVFDNLSITAADEGYSLTAQINADAKAVADNEMVSTEPFTVKSALPADITIWPYDGQAKLPKHRGEGSYSADQIVKYDAKVTDRFGNPVELIIARLLSPRVRDEDDVTSGSIDMDCSTDKKNGVTSAITGADGTFRITISGAKLPKVCDQGERRFAPVGAEDARIRFEEVVPCFCRPDGFVRNSTVTFTAAREPADSSLSNLRIDSRAPPVAVDTDDAAAVEFDVTHTGEFPFAFNATLQLSREGKEAVNRRYSTAELGGATSLSETETVRFENVTDGLEPGAYDLEVAVDNASGNFERVNTAIGVGDLVPVSGTVQAGADETAVEGATVQAIQNETVIATATTDSTGTYRFPKVPVGASILVNAEGETTLEDTEINMREEPSVENRPFYAGFKREVATADGGPITLDYTFTDVAAGNVNDTNITVAYSINETNTTAGQIANLYQLQAIGTNPDLLTADYRLIDDIDASETEEWNQEVVRPGGGTVYRCGQRGCLITLEIVEELQTVVLGSQGDPARTVSGVEQIITPIKGFDPIGDSRSTGRFTGTLDGQEYEITGLHINRPDEQRVGLIGEAKQADIRSVHLTDINVTGGAAVGGLVGFGNQSVTITNTSVAGRVTGVLYTGGAAGLYVGTISQTDTTGQVTGEQFVGGLVGVSIGTVSNTSSSADVESLVRLGGLVGLNVGNVTDSYATGNVTGDASEEFINHLTAGGLVGNSNGNISDSYATGEVTGYRNVGGLVGFAVLGETTSSYASGSVSGERAVGGVVGSLGTPIPSDFPIQRDHVLSDSYRDRGSHDLPNPTTPITVGEISEGDSVNTTIRHGDTQIKTGADDPSEVDTELLNQQFSRSQIKILGSSAATELLKLNFATTWDTVGVDPDSRFAVRIANQPANVTQGDSATVTYAVRNTAGDVAVQTDGYPILSGLDTRPQLEQQGIEDAGFIDPSACQEVTTSVNGEQTKTEVCLGGDQTTKQNIIYDVNTTETDPLEVEVVTNGTRATTTVPVVEPPQFETDIFLTVDNVTEGEEAIVTYEVKNTGDLSGTQDITFGVNGEPYAVREDVRLTGGEQVGGAFNYSTKRGDAPNVTATIQSANDQTNATLAVQPAAPLAEQLTVQTAPATNQTVGQPLTGPPTVQATNGNNTVVGDVPVRAEILSVDNGTTEPTDTNTTVKTDSDGIATFETLAIETTGTFKLAFSITAADDGVATNDTVETAPITVAERPDDSDENNDEDSDEGAEAPLAEQLAIQTAPATNQTVGQPLTGPPTVQVTTRNNTLVGDVPVRADILSVDNGTTEPTGTITTVKTDSDGIATFEVLTIDTPGTFKLAFSITAADDGVATNDTVETAPITVAEKPDDSDENNDGDDDEDSDEEDSQNGDTEDPDDTSDDDTGLGGFTGGGSGGGGGASTSGSDGTADGTSGVNVDSEAVPDTAVRSEAQPFEDAEPETEEVTVNFEAVALEAITFEEAGDEPVTVADLAELPDDVDVPETDIVAALEIDVPETLTDEPATVEFGVDPDAVDDPDSVQLSRYTDGEWEHYAAEPVALADGELIYEARTQGFSTFAVTEAADEEPAETPTDTATPISEVTPTDTATETPGDSTEEAALGGLSALLIGGVVLGLVVTVGAIVAVRSERVQEQFEELRR